MSNRDMDAIPDAERLLTTDLPPFRAQVVQSTTDLAVVALEGEVDIHTSPGFKRALLSLIEEGRQHIVVDAGQVTFMDSTALGVFLSGAKRLRASSGSIVIVCRDHIARLFEITGLDRVFTLCRTREEALRVTAARQEHVGTAMPPGEGVAPRD